MIPDHYGYHVNQPLEPHMRPITLPSTEEKEQVRFKDNSLASASVI